MRRKTLKLRKKKRAVYICACGFKNYKRGPCAAPLHRKMDLIFNR